MIERQGYHKLINISQLITTISTVGTLYPVPFCRPHLLPNSFFYNFVYIDLLSYMSLQKFTTVPIECNLWFGKPNSSLLSQERKQLFPSQKVLHVIHFSHSLLNLIFTFPPRSYFTKKDNKFLKMENLTSKAMQPITKYRLFRSRYEVKRI